MTTTIYIYQKCTHIPVFRQGGIRIWNVLGTIVQPPIWFDGIRIWDFGRSVLVPVVGLCCFWVRDPVGTICECFMLNLKMATSFTSY